MAKITKQEAIKTKNEVGLLIQFLVLVLLFIFAIVSIQIVELWYVTRSLVVILGITMAYNNHTTYKRNGFTLIYLLISLLMYIYIMLSLTGVI